MTTIAIMQPYLFPYIGYYQMATLTDDFVFLDDANFIVRGFINRNNILLQGQSHRFSVPVVNASQNRPINAHFYSEQGTQLIYMLKNAYSRAPFINETLQIVRDVFEEGKNNVAETNARSIQRVMEYVGLPKHWHHSSSIFPRGEFKASRWIIEICRKLGAACYINMPGGRALYQSAEFEELGMELRFVEPVFLPYSQSSSSFVPGLSMIDTLMWCTPEQIRMQLQAGKTSAS